MTQLFSPVELGSLTLPNRLVRSATAERMADGEGRPGAALRQLYRELVDGGVGLIITGHMYVHPGGKCHPEMTGIYSDDLLTDLAALVETVHEAGGLVATQINHGGMQCSIETVKQTVAPSDVDAPFLPQPARAMTPAEIEEAVSAY
ncbi:MAG: NADH:flavin oxidoreductase, partial [Anaerolineae bacterium]